MCGRYFLDIDDESLKKWLDEVDVKFSHEEVFPTNKALVLVYDKELKATVRSWGFTKPNFSQRVINARSETISSLPFFKDAYATSKAIVLASGFYEWDQAKVRHVITPHNDSLIYMAGVIQPDTGNFAILTQPSTFPVSNIHNRQPIMLKKENIEAYCNNRLNVSLSTYASVAVDEHAKIQQASLF